MSACPRVASPPAGLWDFDSAFDYAGRDGAGDGGAGDRFVRGGDFAGDYARFALRRLRAVALPTQPRVGAGDAGGRAPAKHGACLARIFIGACAAFAFGFSALGSILFGFATPTEGAGCGAFGSLLLALAYRRLTFGKLREALLKTLEISALILFLVAASNFFGAVFSHLGTPAMLTDILLGFDLPPLVILLMIMALIFLLGWPLEWVPIVLIIIPVLLPLVEKLGFNLTWFAILVAVNLQTAWLSPPVALSAYFLKGVAPDWDLKDIYGGMLQFMMLQLIGLALIIAFPQIALWLPGVIYD